MAVYPGQLMSAGTRTLRTLTQCTTLSVLKFLTSTLNLPSRPPSPSLGSNTKENQGETAETNRKNSRTRTYVSFIFA